jgi:pilus assembly protein Flp/PilA
VSEVNSALNDSTFQTVLEQVEPKLAKRLMNMKEAIISFFKEEDGLTTVEYAVAGALVAGAVVVAFTDLGAAVRDVIVGLEAAITPPAPPAP